MGKRKIILNPKFDHLADFVESLPQIFENEGCTIYKIRNEIKYFDVDGFLVNVKRFCVPRFFFNRVAYRLIRKSKAQRAFEYASKLLELGIDTPAPIAYIIEGNPVSLGLSYFVSVQVPHKYSVEMLRRAKFDDATKSLLAEVGRYTAMLHDKGICHNDYGHGNILYDYDAEGKPHFCLVDINRMDFGEVSFEKGCANFSKMEGTPEMFRIIAREYATARGYDVDKTTKAILDGVERGRRRRKMKPRKILEYIIGLSDKEVEKLK